MENEKNNNQLQIELKEEVAQGTYANLAIITHSSSEFIVDFVRVMPGLPKAGVQSRIVLTPEHAKRLMYALQENVAKYERNFGPIRMPEEMNGGNNGPDGKTFIPPISGFKGKHKGFCSKNNIVVCFSKTFLRNRLFLLVESIVY